jgi:hypothetical protein
VPRIPSIFIANRPLNSLKVVAYADPKRNWIEYGAVAAFSTVGAATSVVLKLPIIGMTTFVLALCYMILRLAEIGYQTVDEVLTLTSPVTLASPAMKTAGDMKEVAEIFGNDMKESARIFGTDAARVFGKEAGVTSVKWAGFFYLFGKVLDEIFAEMKSSRSRR